MSRNFAGYEFTEAGTFRHPYAFLAGVCVVTVGLEGPPVDVSIVNGALYLDPPPRLEKLQELSADEELYLWHVPLAFESQRAELLIILRKAGLPTY
jgi:hypothetical protein